MEIGQLNAFNELIYDNLNGEFWKYSAAKIERVVQRQILDSLVFNSVNAILNFLRYQDRMATIQEGTTGWVYRSFLPKAIRTHHKLPNYHDIAAMASIS